MNRILILGSSGSGKSTLAQKLGDLLDIEVIHLDSFYWQPNWVATPANEWAERLKELLKKARWVMDGNYPDSLDLRLGYADTVIFMYQGRWVCLWRCIKRFMMYKGENRPELAEGCNEKIDLDFFKWIWNYPRDVNPKIERLLEKHVGKQRYYFRSHKEAEMFLDKISST
ncbi:MAG: topology modulation protein [Anaerolineales bacterium]|nr:topology modulation protein [Anaerolineales bacterium]